MTDDWISITRAVHEFAYGIDTRDWALYRSIFADGPIDFDYSSYHGRPGSSMDADAWVANVRPLFDGLDATQHSMSNPLVDVDGDTARCRMYMQAAHFLWRDDLLAETGSAESEFTIGGYYDDRLVRTASGWKLTAVTLTVFWRRGNAAIMSLATR
ncbi:MAG: nuclear transport factor 2 family protein [Ilumatobacter sp.]|uniref:nuclear transport factor 2 family protein n=1 Tax=Ilumatobacter sp. TaxID=1967498 RepID=UPI0039193FB5